MSVGQRSFEQRLKALSQTKDPRVRAKAAFDLIDDAEAFIERVKELRQAAIVELYDRTKSKNHPERTGNWAEVGRQLDVRGYPNGISREWARQIGGADAHVARSA